MNLVRDLEKRGYSVYPKFTTDNTENIFIVHIGLGNLLRTLAELNYTIVGATANDASPIFRVV